MSDKKRAKKKPAADRKHQDEVNRERRERRFSPESTGATTGWMIAAWLGAALMGSGVWARWVSDPGHDFATYLLLGGAALAAVGVWQAGTGFVVRVGDGGVAVERGSELTRLLWCDIQRISADPRQLWVEAKDRTLNIPLGAHRKAVAWVLREGTRRLPDIMDVKDSVLKELPKPDPKDGESLLITDLQVAGRHCAASGKIIAFERDARVCPNCGQIYHHARVPKRCTTCEQELAGRALSVGA